MKSSKKLLSVTNISSNCIDEICEMFSCKRGDIQTLQALAVNYSGMIAAFTERLGWCDVTPLLYRINEKINWCVKEELLDLM